MEFLVILAVFFVGSFIYSIVSSKKAVKERRKYLENSFGQPPAAQERADMTSVDSAWVQYLADHPDTEAIDDITWNDLDMDEVFHRINICQTSVGEEQLYKALRMANGVDAQFEGRVKAIYRDKEGRVNCQSLLSQLGKAPHSGLAAFLAGANKVHTLDYRLLMLLGYLPFLLLLSSVFIGFTGLVLAIPSAIFNVCYTAYFKTKVPASLSGMRYLSTVLWCAGKLSNVQVEGLSGLLEEIRGAYQVFKSVKSKLSSVTEESMNFSNADALGEFGKLFLMTDVKSYAKSARLIFKNKEKAWVLYEKLGMLDMLISVASFRKSLGAVCVPTYHEEMRIEMERMGHPLIIRPVENSYELKRDTIVTGSNASGKSTFIKAVAVNALLAQAINTCAAKEFKIPRALVISSMALRDSIVKGDSYFVAEIKSLRRIMEMAKKRPCLCFVDEILRGTNTIERIAASAAVLYSLSRENCLCLVASHDIELTRILKNEFDNCHFSETVSDEGVTFDYILKPGPSKTRNAILLLSTMGFDEKVIDEAHGLVKTFEETNAWPAFTNGGDAHAHENP